jgi:hypothetical protein
MANQTRPLDGIDCPVYVWFVWRACSHGLLDVEMAAAAPPAPELWPGWNVERLRVRVADGFSREQSSAWLGYPEAPAMLLSVIRDPGIVSCYLAGAYQSSLAAYQLTLMRGSDSDEAALRFFDDVYAKTCELMAASPWRDVDRWTSVERILDALVQLGADPGRSRERVVSLASYVLPDPVGEDGLAQYQDERERFLAGRPVR